MDAHTQAQDFIHPSNARLFPTMREKIKTGVLFGLAAGVICGASVLSLKALLIAALGGGIMRTINHFVRNGEPISKDMGLLHPAMEERRAFVKEEADKILKAMGKPETKNIEVRIVDVLDRPLTVYSSSKGTIIAAAEDFVGVEDEEVIKALLAHRLAHKALGHTKKKRLLSELSAAAALTAALTTPVTSLAALAGAGLTAALGPKLFTKLYGYHCDYQADRIGAVYSGAPEAFKNYIEGSFDNHYMIRGKTRSERVRQKIVLTLQRPLLAFFQGFSDTPHPLERAHRLQSIGEKQGFLRNIVRDIKQLPRMTQFYKMMPKP